jgi:hypothetical protein
MNEQQLAAVKQALESLRYLRSYVKAPTWAKAKAEESLTTLQSIIVQHALDKKADNARELGLSYDDVLRPVPVKTYHDGKPWPVAPKPWVGLTDEDLEDIAVAASKGNLYDLRIAIEAKLKEKNT